MASDVSRASHARHESLAPLWEKPCLDNESLTVTYCIWYEKSRKAAPGSQTVPMISTPTQ